MDNPLPVSFLGFVSVLLTAHQGRGGSDLPRGEEITRATKPAYLYKRSMPNSYSYFLTSPNVWFALGVMLIVLYMYCRFMSPSC